jgi:hypothetical protein
VSSRLFTLLAATGPAPTTITRRPESFRKTGNNDGGVVGEGTGLIGSETGTETETGADGDAVA